MDDRRAVSKNIYYVPFLAKIIISHFVHEKIDWKDVHQNINCGYLSWWVFM